jgi:hypothetical protein
MTATGCPSAGFSYLVPSEKPAKMAAGELQLDIKNLSNPWGNRIGIELTVTNPTDHVVGFDPDELVIAGSNGKRYHHSNKMLARNAAAYSFTAGVWDQPNVSFANPIAPGQSYSAIVWFDVPWDDLKELRWVDVMDGNQSLRFPPGGAR